MYRTPGFVIPSAFPTKEAMMQELKKKAASSPEEKVSHGMELVENVLVHHGTKGMRWGIRKGRSSAPSHPVSEDHATVQAHTQKAKEGGVKALSNKELQDVITRKNLEKQHRELVGSGTKFDKGHKKIKKILSVAKTLNDIHNTVETTTKVVKAASKAAG